MHCKALIVNCMDPRLQGENLIKIAAAAGLNSGEYEVLDYPGPSLWVTDPHLSGDTESFWRIFDTVSLKLHKVSEAVIIGHSSCGGFALKGTSDDPQIERQTIISSLQKAKAEFLSKYPSLTIKPAFVTIQADVTEGLPDITVELVG